MKIIKQEYKINAPIEKVWQALTNSKEIEKWSGAKTTMKPQEGTKFKLWDGDIYGTNIKVVPLKTLVQNWYSGDWDKPSILTFNLEKKDNKTIVKLTHEGVPEKELNDIENGWKDYYMNPLKELVEEN